MTDVDSIARSIFLEALDHTSGEDLQAFLDSACGNNSDLRRRVEDLLRAHRDAGNFLGVDESSASTIDETPSEHPGAVIGPYKLLEQIGEGGMGIVYLAEQKQPVKRRVALKIIKPGMDTRQVIARFEAERQALAMMDHPNIARVLDAGATDSGRPYFVMELVNGIPITRYCDEQHLNPRERLELFIPICQAVQHAHQKGIIHRDLKPSNVLIALYDAHAVPKVIDFGVAKAIRQTLTEKTLFTKFGQVVGTLEYMSPEQAQRNQLDIDTRSDVYSLGALLYELLTGSTPFERERLRSAAFDEVLRILRDEDPPRPSLRLSSSDTLPSIAACRRVDPRKLSSLLRGELDWIVMRAMEKDRSRRYESAGALAADILRHLNHDRVLASPPSIPYVLRKFVRRNRQAVAAATVLAIALLVALSGTTIGLIRANVANRKANEQWGRAEREAANALTAATSAEAAAIKERSARLAEQQAKVEATAAGERLRRHLYAAHINLAQQAWDAGNVHRVLELLQLHRPTGNQQDLRGFEWFYLWRLCEQSLNTPTLETGQVLLGVAFAPNAMTLVSVGRNMAGQAERATSRLQLWDATTRKMLPAPGFVGVPVWCVAYSDDGTKLATGAMSIVQLWDVATNQLEGVLQGHSGFITDVGFSHDGALLATGSQDRTIRLWNVQTRELIHTFEGHADYVECVEFLRDDSTVVSGSSDHTIRFWDVDSGALLHTLSGHVEPVKSIASTSDGKVLITTSLDGVVKFWDPATRQETASIRSRGRGTDHLALAVSRDDKLLAIGTGSSVAVYDMETRTIQATLNGHSQEVSSLSFSADGNTLASSSWDGTVKLWDWNANGAPRNFSGQLEEVTSMAFSPDDKILAISDSENSIELWDVVRGKLLHTLKAGTDFADGDQFAFSPDASMLASGGAEATVKIWDVVTGALLHSLTGHKAKVYGVAFSPNGTRLASASRDGTTKLWNSSTFEELETLNGNMSQVFRVEFSPNGQTLAAGGRDATIELWDVAKRKLLRTLEGHASWIWGLSFSPDGKTLASASWDKTAILWDVNSGEVLHTLKGHTAWVFHVSFSRDGATLATGSLDGTVKLWMVDTGDELATLTGYRNLASCVFSHDGRTLAVSDDLGVELFRAATELDVWLQDPPQSPQPLYPADDASIRTFPLVLQTSPFQHPHPEVVHATSHWQLWQDGEPDSIPLIDITDNTNLSSLSVDIGLLLPETTYWWRVAYESSNGRTAPWSEVTSFTTAAFPFRPVSLDLSTHFNHDGVAVAGEDFSSLQGAIFVAEGFDGSIDNSPRAHGLPHDRVVGVHRLGDYRRPNAIRTGPGDTAHIRVEVPRGNYAAIRFLVAGDWINSEMPVVFEFADGTTHRGVILCDEWYRAPSRPPLRAGVVPARAKMDWIREGNFEDVNRVCIFEVIQTLDATRELVNLVLETDKAVYTESSTRFNLYAATGVLAADP